MLTMWDDRDTTIGSGVYFFHQHYELHVRTAMCATCVC